MTVNDKTEKYLEYIVEDKDKQTQPKEYAGESVWDQILIIGANKDYVTTEWGRQEKVEEENIAAVNNIYNIFDSSLFNVFTDLAAELMGFLKGYKPGGKITGRGFYPYESAGSAFNDLKRKYPEYFVPAGHEGLGGKPTKYKPEPEGQTKELKFTGQIPAEVAYFKENIETLIKNLVSEGDAERQHIAEMGAEERKNLAAMGINTIYEMYKNYYNDYFSNQKKGDKV